MKLFNKVAAIAVGVMLATGVGAGIVLGSRNAVKAEAADGSVSKSSSDLATENSWTVSEGNTVGTKFSSFALDSNITVSFAGSGNTATYWSSGDIRVYGVKSATSGSVTFTGGTGVTINTITLTFTLSNSPTVSPSITTGTAFTVNANSQTFEMTSGSSKAGQFRITNFACTYSTSGGQVANHDLTYAVGTQGVYDGTTTKTFSVAESGTHTVKTPDEVGISGNTGYLFSTWSDGTNTYNPNSSYTMGSSDVTLTAQWVAGIGLSYDKNNNGASGTMETTYVVSGGTQTVAACSFTAPSGKLFDHWNTASNDSGLDYAPNATITNFTSALTLYAIWADAPTFELVTDATQLTAGTKAIFVAQGTYNNTTYTNAMVTARTTANSASTVVTATLSNGFNAGSVATAAGATVYTLGGTTGAWTIKNGDNQLGFTGTSNNNMKFNEDMADTFAITSSGNNVNVVSNTYNTRGLRYNVNNGSPRFSNYASTGQTAIYMFADIAQASFGTIHHIKVSHAPNILSWHDGSTFSDDGLVVVAFDGADENSANSRLLDSSEYTSSVTNGTVFDDSDIGSKTITISYTGNGSLTDTYNIYVYAAATYELVESTPANWSGNYLIVATIDSGTESIDAGTYAFMSDLSDYDVPTNPVEVTVNGKQITTGQEFEWSFASVAGGYSIQGKAGKYVGWENASKNGMTSSNSAIVNTISNSGSTVQIANTASTTRYLTLSSASGQFRYYTSGSVQLYKLVESDDVADYADMFLETLSTGASAVCKYNESTHVVSTNLDDLKDAWKDLADLFDMLSNADKQQFTQGAADQSGDNLAKALALYDYIAAKYNTRLQGEGYVSNYNFMGRSITPIGSRSLINVGEDSTAAAMVVVVVSAISVTAVGGFFLLKKKPF